MNGLTGNWYRILISAITAVTVVIALTKLVIVYKVYEITHPPRVVSSTRFAAVGQSIDSISLNTSDGLRLAGWYLPPKNSAVIILQHGYHTNRGEMFPIAKMLARYGYGVLLFDFRGHGESEGKMVTFGLNEVKDTEAALIFLHQRSEVDPNKIGLVGNSMGGAVGILAAAELNGIRAMVVEGVFAELKDEIGIGIEVQTPLPATPFASIFQFFVEQGDSYKISDIAPVDKIGRISPRPILILQGGTDERIPIDSGERLFNAAGEPKEFWYDPAIAHAAFSSSKPVEYERRVISFFGRYLMGVQTE